MNIVERKNVLFRLLASFLLLISVGIGIFAMLKIINGSGEDKMLAVIASILVSAFSIIEIGVVIKGWKNELAIYKVAFNPNGKVNNVFAIAVGVASLFGITLFSLAISLYITKPFEPFTTSTLVILCIALFLLVNCISYFIFLIMFKKREINLKKFIK